MAKFRKKPIVVEAEQFLPNDQPLPFKDQSAVKYANGWYVVTAHGDETSILEGDWIVAEPDGRGFYPIKADIFEQTYEPVDDASDNLPPENKYVLGFKINADTLEEIVRQVEQIICEIDRHNGQPFTIVSGSPDSGHTLALRINIDQTRENYFKDLEIWLEKYQVKGGE